VLGIRRGFSGALLRMVDVRGALEEGAAKIEEREKGVCVVMEPEEPGEKCEERPGSL
jgi:hypothetical protein